MVTNLENLNCFIALVDNTWFLLMTRMTKNKKQKTEKEKKIIGTRAMLSFRLLIGTSLGSVFD
jgi:hypothetical protein